MIPLTKLLTIFWRPKPIPTPRAPATNARDERLTPKIFIPV